MNTPGTDNDGRQPPRKNQATKDGFHQESVFGDPDWIAEHLALIRQHYAAAESRGESAA